MKYCSLWYIHVCNKTIIIIHKSNLAKKTADGDMSLHFPSDFRSKNP